MMENENTKKIHVKLHKVLKTNLPDEEYGKIVMEIEQWVEEMDDFDEGFWLGLKNCGLAKHLIKDRYHIEYDFAVGDKKRCEGVTRHGGIMTLGRPYYTQCENESTVMITFKQTPGGFGHDITEGTLPACNDCWKKADKEEGITIIKVEPI